MDSKKDGFEISVAGGGDVGEDELGWGRSVY